MRSGGRAARSAVRAAAIGGMAALAVAPQAAAAGPPPGRAYELVSPPIKNGNAITGTIAAPASGGAVAFSSLGAFADATSSIGGNYVARRTSTGWTVNSLNPPTPTYIPNAYDEFYVAAHTEDLSRVVLDTSYPIAPDDQGLGGASLNSSDLYRSQAGGGFAWLTAKPTLPDTSNEDSGLAAAADDLEWVVFESHKALHPDVAADGPKHVYARVGSTTHLISRDESGDPLPDGGAVGQAGFLINSGPNSWKDGRFPAAVSADGSTVYFASESFPEQLYVRVNALDPGAAETRLVTDSELPAGTDCTDGADFLGASQDGRTAYFSCDTPLDDAAPTSHGIYAYDRTTDDVELIAPHTGPTSVVPSFVVLGQDPDARNLYFTSARAFAPGGIDEGDNLYVIRDGELELITAVNVPDGLGVDRRRVSLSPDGSALMFESTWSIVPAANGRRQVYVYDADATAATEEDKITCASCRPDGSPSEGDAGVRDLGYFGFGPSNVIRPFGNVTDDARRVFFTSEDALLPEDTNGVADAYELRDGDLHLLSSGKDRHPSVFMGASENGVDAFIITHENLTPYDIDNGIADLYSVRLGGGFPAPEVKTPCQGDACKGPAPGRPALSQPATPGTADKGDVPASIRAQFDALLVRAATRRRLAAGRTVSLRVKVNKAGTIRVRGRARIGRRTRTVISASRRATKAGTVSVRVRLSRTARRHLSRGRRLRLTLSVSFAGVREPERMTLNLRNRNGR